METDISDISLAGAVRAVMERNLADSVYIKLMSLPDDEAAEAEAAYADPARRRLKVDAGGLRLFLDNELWLEMTRAQLLQTPQVPSPAHTAN
jgi:hypothetical protein